MQTVQHRTGMVGPALPNVEWTCGKDGGRGESYDKKGEERGRSPGDGSCVQFYTITKVGGVSIRDADAKTSSVISSDSAILGICTA